MNTPYKAPDSTERSLRLFRGVVVCIGAALVAYFLYATTMIDASKYPFKLGLDLAGGSRLVYQADTAAVSPEDIPELMSILREVIERRINVFGVAEPLVQVERSSIVAEEVQERLVVELPGVTSVDDAVKEIGRTPLLEFKLVTEESTTDDAATPTVTYTDTGLTGRYVAQAVLEFGQGNIGTRANEPVVSIAFNDEGAALFETITRENVGRELAIILDGTVVSAPVINEAITGGRAIISGNFTAETAKDLVQNLNFGALPLPIELVSTQTIGSSLGAAALEAGIRAGVMGFIALIIFMMVWYRLTGCIASIALVVYVLVMLALFKLVPVVMTAAGIAGFILSIGLAVDANILIAERIKEELRDGKSIDEAIDAGFARAWSAIRDSNITSIIMGVVLFWLGTALIKGFAFVFVLGVLVSMFSAIFVSRTLLRALPLSAQSKVSRFLMDSGWSRHL